MKYSNSAKSEDRTLLATAPFKNKSEEAPASEYEDIYTSTFEGSHSFSKINVYNKTLVSPFLQRKCKHCEEEEKVQRKEDSIATSKPAQSENFTASLSGGRPLSKSELNFFGSRMGYDFRHVRLHTGKAANESARSIGALAYTHGNDVVFANHQYKPETKVGQRLLAHELTHVIQQGSKSFGTQFIQQQKDEGNLDSNRSMGGCHTCELPGGVGVCCYAKDTPDVPECLELGKKVFDQCKDSPSACLEEAQCAQCKCIAQQKGEQYCRCSGIS